MGYSNSFGTWKTKKRIKQQRFASPFMVEVEVLVVNSSVRKHREKFALPMAHLAIDVSLEEVE